MLDKKDLLLYAVTDRKCIGSRDFYETIENALKGGVTILQLREKELSESQLVEEAVKVKDICRRYNVPLIINDNYSAALKAGADGVHVGIEDAPVAEIRRICGKNFIIGATAKTVAQAWQAEADGADYLGVGAVFPSPTKTNAIRIDNSQLRDICSSVSIPAVAIGGITLENASTLTGSGICGIAVVSALFGSGDTKRSAEALAERFREIIR